MLCHFGEHLSICYHNYAVLYKYIKFLCKQLYKVQSVGISWYMQGIFIWYRFGQRFYWTSELSAYQINAQNVQKGGINKNVFNSYASASSNKEEH